MFYIKWALSTWFGLLYLNKYNVTWDAVLKSLLSDKSIKPKLLGNYTRKTEQEWRCHTCGVNTLMYSHTFHCKWRGH